MPVLHQRDVQAFRFIPECLRVGCPADAKAGVAKRPTVVLAVMGQLTKRGTGCCTLGLAQIEMGIKINHRHALVREGIENAPTMRPGGLVPAAKDQRAHPGLLAGRHRIA